MDNIKIRYTWRRKRDGHVAQNIVPVECLELAGDRPWVHFIDKKEWELVARDLWTGKLDKKGNEIYGGDTLFVQIAESYFNVVVEWNDTNSGWAMIRNLPSLFAPVSLSSGIDPEITSNIHLNPPKH